MDENAYHRLVHAIYDLTLAPAGWPTVLRLLGDAFNCHYAAALSTTPDRNAPCSLGAVGITADDHREFLRAWHKRNVFGSRRPPREAGAIILGRTIMPRAELVRSAMYRCYLAPRGIHEVVRLDFFHDDTRSRSVTLARPWSSGPFTSDEVRLAQTVMPHLQHAASVHARLSDAAAALRSALDAVETVQSPILLLDRQGRVVHASTTGRASVAGSGRIERRRNGIARRFACAFRALRSNDRAGSREGREIRRRGYAAPAAAIREARSDSGGRSAAV